jgi:hypothetical protein
MSQVSKYHQLKLSKKYLRKINDDPQQRKLVVHDITYQGQHFRNLSATGCNPIIQPPQNIYNYGPVFSNIGSIAAPMVFGGTYDHVTNNKNSLNQSSIPSSDLDSKKILSGKYVK